MQLSVLVVSNKKSTRSFASMFDHPLRQTANEQEKEKTKAHKDRLNKTHETDLRLRIPSYSPGSIVFHDDSWGV